MSVSTSSYASNRSAVLLAGTETTSEIPAAPACTRWCNEGHSSWQEVKDGDRRAGAKICRAPLAEVALQDGGAICIEFIREAWFDIDTAGARMDTQHIQLNEQLWLTPEEARALSAVLVRAADVIDADA